MISPAGRKVARAEREKERRRRKNVNSGQLVPLQHTQPLGPVYENVTGMFNQ
jgi:hypothetical protein